MSSVAHPLKLDKPWEFSSFRIFTARLGAMHRLKPRIYGTMSIPAWKKAVLT